MSEQKNILLIIGDNQDYVKVFLRNFTKHFDSVHCAASYDDANKKIERYNITHLLFTGFKTYDLYTCFEQLNAWRTQLLHLKCTVYLTDFISPSHTANELKTLIKAYSKIDAVLDLNTPLKQILVEFER